MTLSSGARLGPYEILSALGAGGMGEVYKARDTRLERIVAIKVLPGHLSSSPELRQRFEREAKTISQLSHPHICALHDVGNQDGVEYLVMEYLEGETLSDRLAKGSLPLEQTLRYGIEIADALDTAHRQGVVHRDLKPGNIMLAKSGVKLLDFGLAKAVQRASSTSSLSVLPTQAGPNLTQEGTILGTVQYMAPEQLEGNEADARTDIFAFGAVLYEMATGKKAFEGKSHASLIGSILHTEPQPISSIHPTTPPTLDRVVKTCLAKDPDERWQSAHDLGQQLRWIADTVSPPETDSRAFRLAHRPQIAWTVAAVLAAALLLTLLRWRSAENLAAPLTVSLIPPENTVFDFRAGPPALSPDGRRIAFVASTEGGENALWIRALDDSSDRRLAGTEGACCPFWSPDGRRLGFFAERKLKRIEANGGAPEALCDVWDPFGGTWSEKGTILYAPGSGLPIHQVSASGGPCRPVTRLDQAKGEAVHASPEFLPDGRRFLFGVGTASSVPFLESLQISSLEGGSPKRLVSSQTNGAYASGHLLFWRDRVLRAQRFDWKRGMLEGEAFQVAEGVDGRPDHASAYFSVSENGLLVYARVAAADISRLLWYDRSGHETGSVGASAYYYWPRLSHDGRRVAVDQSNLTQQGDVWVHELSRPEANQLTFDVADETAPIWSPRDDALVYLRATTGAAADLLRIPADRSGPAEPLFVSPANKHPTDWSPDGRAILFTTFDTHVGKNQDIWVFTLEDRKATPVIATRFDEWDGQFSPDGRWIAYVSNESGRPEVYAQPYPGPGPRRKISTAGGLMPKWRRDGSELFYVAPDRKLMSVSVRNAPALEVGVPVPLFPTRIRMEPPFREYDVSADGQRFLIDTMSEKEGEKPITLAIRWAPGTKR